LLALVEETVDRRAVSTVFQPLVYAHTSEVVGFEAFARGPEGSPLEPPLALMAAASEAGRLEELDWACAAAAARAVLAARLHPSMTVFVNLEPSTLATECPPDLFPAIAKARENLRVVVEMGERSLLDDPSGLLDAVELVRKDDWGVAVDRVGGDRAALVMLPIMKPDVIKVSLPLLKSKPAEDWAETATVVRAYTERTCAVALAQGVEDEGDVLVARSLGRATCKAGTTGGQGRCRRGRGASASRSRSSRGLSLLWE
jgi:EAL domain-containing protein (putative c-di-GMP-specific phosphodiesterase class I)